jgi:hypothetical protein
MKVNGQTISDQTREGIRPHRRQISDHSRAYHLPYAIADERLVIGVFLEVPGPVCERACSTSSIAQELAEFGMSIRAGWIVGPSSFAEYQPQTASYGLEVPLQAVQSSGINAELILRSRSGTGQPHRRPPPAQPVGIHRGRPTPGIPDEGDRRLRFRPIMQRLTIAVDAGG